jgi:hypothetical protein
MAWWALRAAEKFGVSHTEQCKEIADVFGDAYADWSDGDWTDGVRALALCFMAAMAETGDA